MTKLSIIRNMSNIESKIPTHIAIIPDGNRRWAKSKGLLAQAGHKKGVENIEQLVRTTRDMGIKCLTGWAFSTENWKRDKKENDNLFDLLRLFTKRYKKFIEKERIRFIHLGRKDRLPEDVVKIINEMEDVTKQYTDFTTAIGLDYGGHDELLRTIKKLKNQNLEITKENIEKNLDTAQLPKPDLIIRTSGEQRLSGFMSWQCAYAEFYFAKVHFPDFGPKELKKAIAEYMTRNRTFGGN